MRALGACRATAGAAIARSVLGGERWRLAKVSGSQGRQVARREHVGPGCSPGLEGDVASVAVTRQGLLGRRLAGYRGSRRFANCQLDRFWQNGTIGLEGVVLQVASWAHVHLSTWQRWLRMGRRGTEKVRQGQREHAFTLDSKAEILQEHLYSFHSLKGGKSALGKRY